MTHIIKMQLIECTLHNKQDAFNLQHLISGYYRDVILPALERIFDEIAGEDSLICLDRLEIDLGAIPANVIETNLWPDEYEKKFSNQIRDEILKQLKRHKTTKEHSRAGIFRQWIFYMLNGYLGWNGTQFSEQQKNTVLETLATDYNSAAELRKLLTTDPVVSKRISRQHTSAFLLGLIKTLTAINHDQLTRYLDEIVILLKKQEACRFIGDAISETQLRQELWEQCLLLSTIQPAPGPRQLSEQIIRSLNLPADTLKKLLRIKSLQRKIIFPVLQEIANSLPPASKKKDGSEDDIFRISDTNNAIANKTGLRPRETPLPDLTGNIIHPEDGHKIYTANDPTPVNQPTKRNIEVLVTGNIPASEDGIFVQDAGLVLLHAFLPSLFRKLQWTSEGKFIDPGHQQKAIYLLHWLATSATNAPEYELVIPKFLCAYPLQQLIPTGVELKPGELEEADRMLLASIHHWEVLKQTSAEGLRQGFLQRNGKLFSSNDKTYLQVETNTIDVLLDHLPWNLSMIRLPWMNDMLRVEWR